MQASSLTNSYELLGLETSNELPTHISQKFWSKPSSREKELDNPTNTQNEPDQSYQDTFMDSVLDVITQNLEQQKSESTPSPEIDIKSKSAEQIASVYEDSKNEIDAVMAALKKRQHQQRKQIQFNLDSNKTKRATTSTERQPMKGGQVAANFNGTTGSRPQTRRSAASGSVGGGALGHLSELLNQLKMNEIRKRRAALQRRDAAEPPSRNVTCCTWLSRKLRLAARHMHRWQVKLGAFIERPYEHRGGLLYVLLKFSVILFSILIGALTTLPTTESWPVLAVKNELFYFYELFATVFLSVEYALFVWSIGRRLGFRGLEGRVRFVRQSLLLTLEALLMPVSLCIFVVSVSVPGGEQKLHLENIVHVLRFFQIFRFLFIDRYAQTWKLLLKVVYKHRFELITSVYIGTIILLFSSYFILIFEKEYSVREGDNHFLTYADALYWSVITMATIGYGDRSPRTFQGKIISTTLCILGMAFWTLPGGIIGSGFAFKIEEKNKQNQLNRLLPAAATLIQSWWRMKATLNIYSSPTSTSTLIATVATFNISRPIYSSSLRRFKKHLDQNKGGALTEEANNFFLGLDSPPQPQPPPPPPLSALMHRRSLSESHAIEVADAIHHDDELSPFVPLVTHKFQAEIIRNLSEEAKSEEKANIDSDTTANNNNNININININDNNITSHVNSASARFSSHSSSHSQSHSAILLQLSPEHLILIRTILLMKFFAAQNKFKLAFKPYDFKDVIEQYKQGNADILVKIKDLHRRLDQAGFFHQHHHLQQQQQQNQKFTIMPNSSHIAYRSISPLFHGSQLNSRAQMMRTLLVGSPPSLTSITPPPASVPVPNNSSSASNSSRLNRVWTAQNSFVTVSGGGGGGLSDPPPHFALSSDQIDSRAMPTTQHQWLLPQQEFNSGSIVFDRLGRLETDLDRVCAKIDRILNIVDKSPF